MLGGKKTKLGGYSIKDYKEWGKLGGRPIKWESEAERKRYARIQKALAEGRELRGYKSYKKETFTDPKKFRQKAYCPNCKSELVYPHVPDQERVEKCQRCGYLAFPGKSVFWQAGTSTEQNQRSREKKEDDEEDEEEEEY